MKKLKEKILLMGVLTLLTMPTMADGILRVVPFNAVAGTTSDDAACFEIEMTNSEIVWGFQFEMLLPEGMTLDTTYDPFELNEDRFPYTEDRKHNKTFDHSIQYNQLEDGWIRVMVFATDAETRISENEGVVLYAYYLTSESMPTGVYPIDIRAAKMAITPTESIIPAPAQTAVAVEGQSKMDITFTLTDAGWGTLMLPFDAAVPTGLTAYSCEEVTDDVLQLQPQESIVSGVPYVMGGKAGNYTFQGIPEVKIEEPVCGQLRGTYLNNSIEEGYVLQNGDLGIAFYRVNAEKPVTVPAWHCSLAPQTGTQASMLRMGDTTGIMPLTMQQEDHCYGLDGIRMTATNTGEVFIMNGKKYLKFNSSANAQ